MRKILIVVLLASLSACGIREENEQLKTELATLRGQLDENEEMNEQLEGQVNDINILLDSIESTEDNITLQLEKGTTYDSYTQRITRLNNYLQESREKLRDMEQSLGSSEEKNKALAAMIKNFRRDLEEREERIKALSTQVETYRNKNQELIQTNELQKRELAEREEELEVKRQEAEDLGIKIEGMLVEAKQAQAAAYFFRGEALEEAANRTKLAPKKKKETYKEAYDLYKKAFEEGHKEAYNKMQSLESKID